jgi:cold shock CspA family protein
MYFGTIRKFDPITGKGEIKPDVTGNAVRFQRDAIAWDPKIEPIVGQRFSYDVGRGAGHQSCALNLQTI